MENSNFDETVPTPLNPEGEESPSEQIESGSANLNQERPSSPDLDQTVATPLKLDSTGTPDLDQTVATSVNNSQQEVSGYEETIPPPGETSEAESAGSQGISSTEAGSLPEDLPPAVQPPKQTRRSPWGSWAILGLLALILIAATSAFSGYRAGIHQRTVAETAQRAQRIQEQYQLGLQDMEAGHYNLARQRFEYVIQLNPNYPGVTENLAKVLLELNATATPTLVPTPTVSPTPDTRNVDQLFSQAQQDLSNEDWDNAINTLLSLRKADSTYQAVWVDDMLYIALRNRGEDKILKNADLEGGIYDLSLAERFGPLDENAKSYLTWARLYITGASFWEIDWSQAVYYFAQVAPAMPNLRDGSGWTAQERYRLALIGYGGYLADQKDWCNAAEQYRTALTIANDPKVEETLNFVSEKCSPPSHENQPPPETTEAPPPAEAPTDTPVPPTQEPYPYPNP